VPRHNARGIERRSNVAQACATASRGRENSERRRGIICDRVPPAAHGHHILDTFLCCSSSRSIFLKGERRVVYSSNTNDPRVDLSFDRTPQPHRGASHFPYGDSSRCVSTCIRIPFNLSARYIWTRLLHLELRAAVVYLARSHVSHECH